MQFISVQILGAATLILFLVSVQLRKKENLLLLQSIATLLYIAQYVIRGTLTPTVLFGIVAIRGLVFFYCKKKDKKPSLAVLLVFLIALVISTCITWKNMLSIIPLIATLAKTWGTWQDDMKWLRRTSFIGQSCMIAYNLTAALYTLALTEACNLVSTIIAICRYDLRKKQSPDISEVSHDRS